MVGNDVQMLTGKSEWTSGATRPDLWCIGLTPETTGIALMITAFVLGRTTGLDLYHLHLIFDTVSFVGYVDHECRLGHPPSSPLNPQFPSPPNPPYRPLSFPFNLPQTNALT